MLSRVVIAIVCLCVVKAAAFTINAYEDDYEMSVRSCVNSECNTVCRLLGFARGVCVSANVCRCYERSASDETAQDVDPAALNDFLPAKSSTIEDVSLDATLRSCVNSQCNALCRRLGFARGVCISANVCRCSGRLASDATLDNIESDFYNDVSLDKSNPTEDISFETSLRSCVNSQCNALCRRLGFARGVCISANVCRCSGRLASDATLDDITLERSNPLEDLTLDTTLRACVNSQCNTICRRLGFARGVCVSANVCRCSGRLASEVAFDEFSIENNNPSEDVSLETSLRSCVNSQCNALCRRLGFARGVCISANVCRCSGRLASDAAFDGLSIENNNPSEDVSLETSLRSCVNSQCNALCRRLGYARGVCVSANVCRCSGRLAYDANEVETENKEVAETTEPKSCNPRWCDQNCRRIGYPGGACVNGRCKCDLLYSKISLLAPSETDSNTIEDNEINADSEPAAENESNDIPQNN